MKLESKLGLSGMMLGMILATGAGPAVAAEAGPFTGYMDIQTARVLPQGRTTLAIGGFPGGTILGSSSLLGLQAAVGLAGDAELLVNTSGTFTPPYYLNPGWSSGYGVGLGVKELLSQTESGSLAAVAHVSFHTGSQYNYALYAGLPQTLAWGPGELTYGPYFLLPDLGSQSVNIGFANAGTIGVQAGYLRPLLPQLDWISEGALAYHTSRFPVATLRTGLRYAPVPMFCLDASAGLNLAGAYPALAENYAPASLTARLAF